MPVLKSSLVRVSRAMWWGHTREESFFAVAGFAPVGALRWLFVPDMALPPFYFAMATKTNNQIIIDRNLRRPSKSLPYNRGVTMPHSSFLPPPSPTLSSHSFVVRDAPDSDADTASQRSISLSSPPASPRHSSSDPRRSFSSGSDPRQSFASGSDPRQSFASSNPRQSFATSTSSGSYSHAAYTDEPDPFAPRETPDTSAAPSIYDEPSSYYKPDVSVLPTYPPPHRDDSISISSFASGSSRKTRPESLLVTPPPGKLVLGIALVDFNHLVFHHSFVR